MLKCFWGLVTVSISILLLGFVLFIFRVGESVRNGLIAKNFQLTPENKQFWDSWMEPIGTDGKPIGSNYDFYLWNITNPKGFMAGQKPSLQQVGPFCYKNFNKHVNVSTQDGKVFYKNRQTYIKRDCKTSFDGDALIYHINIPYLIVHNTIRGSFMAAIAKSMFPKDGSWELIVSHRAEDAIWGYVDPVLKKLKNFGQAPTEYFGYFLGQNGTDSKEYVVSDGSGNIRSLTQIISWNDKKGLYPIWSTNEANTILGTDGNNLPPLLEHDKRLYLFVDSMCRSLYFKAAETPVNLGPVETWKYSLPASVFQGAAENPLNQGFCAGDICLPSGLLNLTTCFKDTYDLSLPYVLSKPHLLDVDQSVQSQVLGLSPDSDKHGTDLFVEPITGLLLGASKNLQFNVYLNSIQLEEGKMDPKIAAGFEKGIYVPSYWISQSFEASPPLLNYVSEKILSMLSLVEYFPLILLAIGVVGCLVSFIIGVKIHVQENDQVYAKGQPQKA